MVGAGQLARMTAQAAIPLGIGFRVLAETSRDSAAQVCGDIVVGDYRKLSDLRTFTQGCDVVTFDHEHVPAAHLHELATQGVRLAPSPEALRFAQDKVAMRERLDAAGLPVPEWSVWRARHDGHAVLLDFAERVGWPLVIKAPHGGYDGRGVWVVDSADEAAEVVAGTSLADEGALLEAFVPFRRELAALVARSSHGQAVAYPVVETVQLDGICREVVAPAPMLSDEQATRAQQIALDIAGLLDVVGVLAVEMFEGADGQILVNELAMRPHNSGHWTIDGAVTSQFEQHLRAVLDLPLGSPAARAPWTVMVNVLGGDKPDMYRAFLHCMARDPGLRIHMYGKEVRPGRKVGHVTVAGEGLEDLRHRARHAAAFLEGTIDE